MPFLLSFIKMFQVFLWGKEVSLIVYLISLSIVILIFAMIVWIVWHVWIHCYTLFDLTCRFSGLYILLIVFEHDVCITIHFDYHSLCVHEWYILLCLTVWCMTALPLHDCMPLVYVGLTSIPLLPNLLVSVISFISVLTFASVRPSMCLFSDWAKD